MSLKICVALVAVAMVGVFVWYTSGSVLTIEQPSAGIEGSTWMWQQTELNNGEIRQPAQAGAFTLTFADGRVSGTTDCNSFSGSYQVGAGDTLAFGPFASTKMYCDGSQEAEFTRMVADSTSFLVTPSGDLVLHIKFDSGSVVFVRS